MTNEIEDKRRFTEAAIRFAQSGGEVLMEYFGTEMQIRDKGVGNLVSEADLISEQTIVELIRSEFPGHSVLAEERHATAVGGRSLWIVDPLDGTNNFTHGVPHFAVSVAFYKTVRRSAERYLIQLRAIYLLQHAVKEHLGTAVRYTFQTRQR